MSHAERERTKRAMGIGCGGHNDLDRNVFRVEKYIVVHGVKYQVIETGDRYCAQILPGRHVYGATIESLRDSAQWSLDRAAEEAAHI